MKYPTINKLWISSQIVWVCVKLDIYLSSSSYVHFKIIDDDIQDDLRVSLDVQARLLYGLIHARWIVTARGLTKMVSLLISLISEITPPQITRGLLTLFSNSSLTNSNERTLVAAHVFYAHPNLSFPSDSRISLTKNQSNCIVDDAKTFILPNPHDTDPSMVLISEPPSHTSSFSSTQPSFHLKTLISHNNNKTLSLQRRTVLLHLILGLEDG